MFFFCCKKASLRNVACDIQTKEIQFVLVDQLGKYPATQHSVFLRLRFNVNNRSNF